jgi:hypothetical protein
MSLELVVVTIQYILDHVPEFEPALGLPLFACELVEGRNPLLKRSELGMQRAERRVTSSALAVRKELKGVRYRPIQLVKDEVSHEPNPREIDELFAVISHFFHCIIDSADEARALIRQLVDSLCNSIDQWLCIWIGARPQLAHRRLNLILRVAESECSLFRVSLADTLSVVDLVDEVS